jgi:glycosyltransferase involved in cell wall biosynthesis
VNHPLVSVVTPFHNTAAHLAECIESVLAQTYPCIEYVLVDNCSTDGAEEVAESYARRDRRIRLIRRSQLLSQVQNYNAALAEISADSRYCKIVQADDFIFPDCLRLMVQAFEQSETVGLVSAYDLKGDVVRGSGFPNHNGPISGRELARLVLRTGIFVFGSPTTVMYRSSLVRSCHPFYDEDLLHEDTEKCMQILETWDFSFVPQVLSFLRLYDESISGTVRTFQPNALDRYIIVQRFSGVFLDESEAATLRKKAKKSYYDVLALEALRFREEAFWRYHRKGLHTLHKSLDRVYLALRIGKRLGWMIANPGITVNHAVHRLHRGISQRIRL